MPAATLSNLLAYSLQIACVAAAGAALPAVLRLRAPDVGYAYWRALVLLCLALPWVQQFQVPAPPSPTLAGAPDAMSVPAVISANTLQVVPVDWTALVATLIAVGIALRFAWMAAGLVQLRRLRGAGSAAEIVAESDDLQQTMGTRAEIRYVSGLQQPATFGVRRPVVLLPDGLREHPSDIRRAVLVHELFHVQRRDWAWVLAEECIRAVFWFHPAMWWLISRVQIAREEAVDEVSVLLTGQRRTYAEALLTFADTSLLAPAPAFARRRHLIRRMSLMSSEVVMSSRRVVASCVVMGCVVAAGTWRASAAFPLEQARSAAPDQATVSKAGSAFQEPGPLEKRANPITPENPIPRRLTTAAPDYPVEAAVLQARGSITLLITLDELGRVAESRPTAVSVSATGASEFSFSLTASSEKPLQKIAADLRRPDGAPDGMNEALGVIEAFNRSASDAVRQWRYDPPVNGPISFSAMFTFGPKAVGSVDPKPSIVGFVPAPKPAQDASWMLDGAVRIGGAIKPPTKTRHVAPVYPPEAQANHVTGIVIIEARVEADGTVSRTRVLKSVPMLDDAAEQAVRQWEFTPTLLNGVATPVVMTVTVNFAM